MDPVTIETMLTAAGSVFTKAVGFVGTVAATIAGNNLLLLGCVGVPLCGIGVGMFGRLLRSRL